jgi:hypothetical protein
MTTPRKAPSACSTGVDFPSTDAFHPGNQVSATTSSIGLGASTSTVHEPGDRLVTVIRANGVVAGGIRS